MNRSILPILSIVSVLGLGACAPLPPQTPGQYLAPGFAMPIPGARVVFLPPEADHPEFAPGLAALQNQLHIQLRAAGHAVVMLDKASHDRAWAQEVAAVGGIYDPVSGAYRGDSFARALASHVRRVAGETGAALVLRPRLGLRTARLENTKAAWDGQLRIVPTRGAAGDVASYSGSTLGLSIDLQALAPNGELMSRSFGGAALPFVTHLGAERNELRTDLFASEQEIADGIAIALRPLLRARPPAR